MIETTIMSLLSVFIAGLLSGVHCLGMCGGIVAALTFGVDSHTRHKQNILFLLLYNIGRISSYTLSGIIVGGIGSVVTQQFTSHTLHQYLQTFSAIIMILMGLYLARWWLILTKLEKAGGLVWRLIEPYARRLIPISHAYQALLVGLLWGWLPCGLVYSMLTLSLSSSNAIHGGLIMLSFGLGTLPNLLLLGVFAANLRRFMQQPAIRIIAGLLVIAMGVYLLYNAWWPVADPHTHQH